MAIAALCTDRTAATICDRKRPLGSSPDRVVGRGFVASVSCHRKGEPHTSLLPESNRL